MANHLFYIENDVNERGSKSIRGYFSTLDKAQEALKDCCDWYPSKGTGEIYRVDMDTLHPHPVLVCKDGIIEPDFRHEYGPQFNLNAIVTDEQGHRARVMAYEPETNKYQLLFVDPENISQDGWYSAEQLKPYESSKRSFIDDLMDGKASFSDIDKYVEYWHTHDTGDSLQDFLGLTDDEFEEWAKSSDNIIKNYVNQRSVDNSKNDTKDLNSLIATAKSISDQSAQLSSDLQKHKESLELEH